MDRKRSNSFRLIFPSASFLINSDAVGFSIACSFTGNTSEQKKETSPCFFLLALCDFFGTKWPKTKLKNSFPLEIQRVGVGIIKSLRPPRTRVAQRTALLALEGNAPIRSPILAMDSNISIPKLAPILKRSFECRMCHSLWTPVPTRFSWKAALGACLSTLLGWNGFGKVLVCFQTKAATVGKFSLNHYLL